MVSSILLVVLYPVSRFAITVEPGSEVGTRIPGSLGRVWKKNIILSVADEITSGAALMEN